MITFSMLMLIVVLHMIGMMGAAGAREMYRKEVEKKRK